MRKLLFSTLLVAVIGLMAVGSVWSAGDVDTEYLMRVGDYFDVSYDEVDAIASGNISIEEVPTIFYMAQLAGRSPQAVLKQRESGKSWSDFMKRYRIHPGSVLTKIYRYDSPECRAINDKVKHKALKTVEFSDEDVLVMVNYKFLAETYDVTYAALLQQREGSSGEKTSFVDINHQSPDRSELANAK